MFNYEQWFLFLVWVTQLILFQSILPEGSVDERCLKRVLSYIIHKTIPNENWFFDSSHSRLWKEVTRHSLSQRTMKRILVPAEDPSAIRIRQKRAWWKALMEVKKYSFCLKNICIQPESSAVSIFRIQRHYHWHQRKVCENVMALVHESSS